MSNELCPQCNCTFTPPEDEYEECVECSERFHPECCLSFESNSVPMGDNYQYICQPCETKNPIVFCELTDNETNEDHGCGSQFLVCDTKETCSHCGDYLCNCCSKLLLKLCDKCETLCCPNCINEDDGLCVDCEGNSDD